jgi:hypothetical protein
LNIPAWTPRGLIELDLVEDNAGRILAPTALARLNIDIAIRVQCDNTTYVLLIGG